MASGLDLKVAHLIDFTSGDEFTEELEALLSEVSPGECNAIAKEGLVRTVIQKANQVPVPHFVTLMKLWAKCDGFEETLYNTGAVSYLTEVIATSLKDKEVVFGGCYVIGMLATEPKVRSCLSVEGGIKVLIQVLQEYTNDPEMASIACAALGNSLFKSNFNKNIFIREEGFPILLSIIRKFIRVEKPLTHSLLALRSLCHTDSQIELLASFGEEEAIDVLMELLEQTHTLSFLNPQLHLIWAIINVTLNSRDLKIKVGEKGGIGILQSIINDNIFEERLLEAAAYLLYRLFTEEEIRSLACNTNIFQTLIECVKTFSSSVQTLLPFFKALSRLFRSELPNCKISGQDVVSLIAVAHSHVTDLELTRASLNIIQNLIIADEFLEISFVQHNPNVERQNYTLKICWRRRILAFGEYAPLSEERYHDKNTNFTGCDSFDLDTIDLSLASLRQDILAQNGSQPPEVTIREVDAGDLTQSVKFNSSCSSTKIDELTTKNNILQQEVDRNDLRERNHQNEDLKNKELYVVTTMLSSDAFTFTTDKSSRDNLKTIEALNRTNIKISAEFKAIQNDLYIAEDTNKKLQEELQANANNIQHMQVANSELEELLWNYLVLSLKLSSQNEDRKWGTLGKLRERVQAEKIPYSKWGEYILEALGENTSRANSNRNTTTTTTKTSRRTSKKK